MQQEQSYKFPNLVCPRYRDPITMVSEDNKNIMNSRLLCSRSIANEYKELFTQNRQQLVVIEDFLKEVTEPSPIVNSSDPASKDTLKNLPQLRKDFEQKSQEEQRNLQVQQHQLREQLKQKANDLGSLLTQNASLAQQRQLIELSGAKLQSAVERDPLVAADIPKPASAIQRIESLRESDELPQYLFGLVQKQRAWKSHATPQLLQWKIEQEKFYSDRLFESLNQAQTNSNFEQAKAFFNQQFDLVASQVQQILQEEEILTQNHYLNLNLSSAQSLSLVTNEMITSETKLVYSLNGDISSHDGELIHQTLQRLVALQNIEFQFNSSSSKSIQDLSEIAKGLLSMKQLRVLIFNVKNGNLSNEQSTFFFGQIAKSQDALPNLQELSLDFSTCSISKVAAFQVLTALQKLGNQNVKSLSINFNGCSLTSDFGAALATSLKTFKGLRTLRIDLGGFSLNSNLLKDSGFYKQLLLGFIPIVQALDSFAEHLSSLELNVSHNQLSDESLLAFHQCFRSSKWPRLKDVNLILQRNDITGKGIKKLAKSIQSLVILLKFQVNLGQNLIDLQSVKQLIQQLPGYLQVQKVNVRGCGLNEDEVQNYVESNHLQDKLLV